MQPHLARLSGRAVSIKPSYQTTRRLATLVDFIQKVALDKCCSVDPGLHALRILQSLTRSQPSETEFGSLPPAVQDPSLASAST